MPAHYRKDSSERDENNGVFCPLPEERAKRLIVRSCALGGQHMVVGSTIIISARRNNITVVNVCPKCSDK